MTTQKDSAFEVGFDGLVGSSHNYGGLSYGNVASLKYKSLVSNPRDAALQGLMKMKFLADLGLKQAVLAPQERPDFRALRRLGFSGSEAQILEKAPPELLASCYSASSMWTANAATVTPSADAEDGKVHLTPANLNSKFHRSLEPPQTAKILKAIFSDPEKFEIHEPLPSTPSLGDEGAANHTRFCEGYGGAGLELFVFGRHGFRTGMPEPRIFPARQTLEASEAVARLHRLPAAAVTFAQQNPVAIDGGAFHNDVVSVGNRNFFFCHELAFLDQKKVLQELKSGYRMRTGGELHVLEVKDHEVSLSDAVQSYLFNSQVASLDDGSMALVAPIECRERESVHRYLEELLKKGSSPLRRVHYFDLRQSMRNGGGPACLRLRVVLTEAELRASNPGVFLTDALYGKLTEWVVRHYRDQLSPEDLKDPRFVTEGRSALDELTRILNLGSIYPFQK